MVQRFEKLRELIASGQLRALDKALEEGDLGCRDPEGCTLLHYAAGAPVSSAELTELLLKRGADPNTTDHRGFTPLHVAAKENNADVVALLLQAGADTTARTRAGATALLHAFLSDAKTTVGVLSSHEAGHEVETDVLRLDRTCLESRRIDEMAQSPAKDFVLTALMEQLGSKCLDVAGLPFEEGFEQRTAAVVEQYLPFVEALLRAGADANRDIGDWTAMDVAVQVRSKELMKLLLRYGGRVTGEIWALYANDDSVLACLRSAIEESKS